jgi:hypothetical protein
MIFEIILMQLLKFYSFGWLLEFPSVTKIPDSPIPDFKSGKNPTGNRAKFSTGLEKNPKEKLYILNFENCTRH